MVSISPVIYVDVKVLNPHAPSNYSSTSKAVEKKTRHNYEAILWDQDMWDWAWYNYAINFFCNE